MIDIHHYGANCVSLHNNTVSIYMSYKTVVAIGTKDFRVRVDHFYSNTTSRHLTKMGVNHYKPIPLEEFKELVDSITITMPTSTMSNANV